MHRWMRGWEQGILLIADAIRLGISPGRWTCKLSPAMVLGFRWRRWLGLSLVLHKLLSLENSKFVIINLFWVTLFQRIFGTLLETRERSEMRISTTHAESIEFPILNFIKQIHIPKFVYTSSRANRMQHHITFMNINNFPVEINFNWISFNSIF